ncbi:MAG: ABC transporter permease, partial [bacterium]
MNSQHDLLEVNQGLIARLIDYFKRAQDSDLYYSFRRSPVIVSAFIITMIMFLAAFLAPWIAPHQTLDLKTLDLMNAYLPPAWEPNSDPNFLLGTDDQGRDILSGMMFGLRISLGVGFASVVVSAIVGTLLGLLSGYLGGRLDSFIMRVADVQLTFPAILIALLIDGIVGSLLPKAAYNELKLYVLVLAIAASQWVNFA